MCIWWQPVCIAVAPPVINCCPVLDQSLRAWKIMGGHLEYGYSHGRFMLTSALLLSALLSAVRMEGFVRHSRQGITITDGV